jgi:hypothetical protein
LDPHKTESILDEAGFEVLTVVTMKSAILWVVMPYSSTTIQYHIHPGYVVHPHSRFHIYIQTYMCTVTHILHLLIQNKKLMKPSK